MSSSKTKAKTTKSSWMEFREMLTPIWSACVAGILASCPCCALQVGLNVLSALNVVHIAGGQSWLAPLRFQLRVLTVCWLGYLWYKWGSGAGMGEKRASRLRVLRWQTLLTLGLMFLPEISARLATFGVQLPGASLVLPTAMTSSEPLPLPIAPIAPKTDALRRRYIVPGLHCEGCAGSARRVLEDLDGVQSATVSFPSGEALVVMEQGRGEFHSIFEDAQLELQIAGYGLEVVAS